jgi:menaquinone-dependent protoporphyrinogen oxidase
MPRILVVYGTTDGQTAKVADAMAGTLRQGGHVVDVHAAAEPAPSPDGYDAVIVSASVHAGGYQRVVRRWVRTHQPSLEARPTAFVSVCLGVLQHEPEVQRDLQRILAEFVASTGWHPGVTKLVAGALPYTRYGWLRRLAMRRIVAKAGGDTDTSRDYEYTDWDDVRRFATGFARELPQPAQIFPNIRL